MLKSEPATVVEKTQALVDKARALEKELNELKAQLASQKGASLLDSVQEISGVKVLVAQLDGVDSKTLRGSVDELKNKLGSGIVMLAVADGGKISLIAGVTKDLIGKVKAGELVNMVAQQVGGKGGGRPDMAMAGGSDVAFNTSCGNNINTLTLPSASSSKATSSSRSTNRVPPRSRSRTTSTTSSSTWSRAR